MKTVKPSKIAVFGILFILRLLWSQAAGPAAVIPTLAEASGGILYVKPGVTGGDCHTWETACDLQTALSSAGAGDEIWVAAGVHTPGSPGDRDATFMLKSGVAIYGGFAGSEISREERDWSENLTILSGDLDADGSPAGNAYHVVTGRSVDATAVLDGFVITAGRADHPTSTSRQWGAGMVVTNSSLTLSNLVIRDNYAYAGGGMYNAGGSPRLIHVSFVENVGSYWGGGMYNYQSPAQFLGGIFSKNWSGNGAGLYNNASSPTLTDVTFADNEATWSGKGGGMFNDTGSPALTNMIFSYNLAREGGGLYNDTGSPTLERVNFIENSVQVSGGGIFNGDGSPVLTRILFSGNTAAYQGGGLFNDEYGTPQLTYITFTGNHALAGGGMMDYSGSKLNHIIFSENSAEDGGGMATHAFSPAPVPGSPTDRIPRRSEISATDIPSLNDVTFSGNTATEGGGMHNDASNPNLTNVTFTDNHASLGGAMYNEFFSYPDLTNATITANSADQGGGIYDATVWGTPSYVKMTNSILWGNTPDQINGSQPDVVNYCDIQGGYPSGEGNIDLDPMFGLLGNHGGFTQVYSLLPGSPAIDAGSPEICPPADQRGVARPADGDVDGQPVCDMGAYEFLPAQAYLMIVVRNQYWTVK